MKYYKKKTTVRRYKRKYTKKPSLKRQMLRLCETKTFGYEEGKAMLHNVYYQYSPTQQIEQGITNQKRVGDEIYLMSLQLSGFFNCSTASNVATKFRCLVFWSPEDTAAEVLTDNVVVINRLFEPNTSSIPGNGIINPRAVTLLADFVIDVSQAISTATEFKSFNVKIPLNQKFKYRDVNSAFGKFKNLYVTFVSAVQVGATFGTNASTPAGGVSFASVLKWKDP